MATVQKFKLISREHLAKHLNFLNQAWRKYGIKCYVKTNFNFYR